MRPEKVKATQVTGSRCPELSSGNTCPEPAPASDPPPETSGGLPESGEILKRVNTGVHGGSQDLDQAPWPRALRHPLPQLVSVCPALPAAQCPRVCNFTLVLWALPTRRIVSDPQKLRRLLVPRREAFKFPDKRAHRPPTQRRTPESAPWSAHIRCELHPCVCFNYWNRTQARPKASRQG